MPVLAGPPASGITSGPLPTSGGESIVGCTFVGLVSCALHLVRWLSAVGTVPHWYHSRPALLVSLASHVGGVGSVRWTCKHWGCVLPRCIFLGACALLVASSPQYAVLHRSLIPSFLHPRAWPRRHAVAPRAVVRVPESSVPEAADDMRSCVTRVAREAEPPSYCSVGLRAHW